MTPSAVSKAIARLEREVIPFSTEVVRALYAHRWPGNVRELENAMERAVALSQSRRIEVDELPEDIRRALPPPTPALGVLPLCAVERDYILAALARCAGNKERTAAELGIGPSTLYRKLKQLGIQIGRRGEE